MMDVNVASMFLTCRAAVPARCASSGGGKIVNISSGTPFRGVPFLLHYVTSKGAIVAFTRALAQGARQGQRARQLRRARVHDVGEGVEAHPEVRREAARRVGRGAHDPARPGAGGRRRRGRLPLRARLGLRHRADDRHRRRPVLPLILRLTQHPDGVTTEPATASSTTSSATRRTSARRVDGRRSSGSSARRGRRELAPTSSSTRREWLVRCDRVDFPPGGVAYLHTHPGPGIRCLLYGADPDRDATGERTSTARRARGSRAAPTPVLAAASRDRGDGVRPRARSCRAEWAGKRTIRYVDPADEEQAEAPAGADLPRASRCEPLRRGRRSILVDQLAVHGVDTRLLRAGRELPRRARRAPRLADPARHLPPRGRRGEHGRGVRQAHRPARRLLRHARAGRDARVGRRPHGVPGLDAADPARRPGRRATRSAARRSRRSTTARMFGGARRSGSAEVDRAARMPELVSRAFHDGHVAGRPGPVVLALPEDVLSTETADVADAEPYRRSSARSPAADDARAAARAARRAPSGRS